MDSFISKKNKLKFIYDQSIKDNQKIYNQQLKNNNEINKTYVNLSSTFLFNKIIDFSTSWEQMDTPDTPILQYKVWEIDLNTFDLRLLPHLDIKVLHRVTGGSIEDTLHPNLLISKTFLIKDIYGESNTNYKNVIANISVYLSAWFDLNPYEAKLNIFFTNPREYR